MMNENDLTVDTICLNLNEYISILKKYAVRVTHNPTGITAICGNNRSQHKNRLTCIAMLEAGIPKTKEKQ
jgi:peptide chain release factor 2